MAKQKDPAVDNRLARINARKKEIGSQEDRMLRSYSANFLEMYNFFLTSYQAGILTFCGSVVNIVDNPEASDAKFGFREFENGRYKLHNLQSSQPEELKAVITAKKAWGLWVKEWSEGIGKGLFIKAEIWELFNSAGIGIPLFNRVDGITDTFTDGYGHMMPKPFYQEFENAVYKARILFGDTLMADLNRQIYFNDYHGKTTLH